MCLMPVNNGSRHAPNLCIPSIKRKLFFYLYQDKILPKAVFRCKNDSILGKMPIFAHELDINGTYKAPSIN